MKAFILMAAILCPLAGAHAQADSPPSQTEKTPVDLSPLTRFLIKTQYGGPQCRHSDELCDLPEDCCSGYCADGPALHKICYGG